jgi:hypothetical protein
MYFPEYDPDDLNRIIAVNLVELIVAEDQEGGVIIHRQRYSYDQPAAGENRKVISQEATYKAKQWWDGKTQVRIQQISAPFFLPDPINTIPVYAYKNKPWQGQPFGCSELRGHESLQARINQSTTDEDVALALEGLGVYATDAPQPTRVIDGRETVIPWVIAPGFVAEVPTGSYFRRVEGLKSVEPFQAHIKFLQDSMYEATATFRPTEVDAQVAQSGIALAIKFLPTMAKLEERDLLGVSKTQQMTHDLKAWFMAYDGVTIPETEEALITLGDKLPEDKAAKLNVLNNMLDRKTVTKEWYREQIHELYGLEIPDNMEKLLEDEARAAMELQQEMMPDTGIDGGTDNQSNNRNRPNESGGTEAK